jgi:hypothetical protein
MIGASEMSPVISTPIDQWKPITPGIWEVQSAQSSAQSKASITTAFACPFPSLVFLRTQSDVKLGKAGCRFETRRLSEEVYHIVGRCALLSGKMQTETTTLHVTTRGTQFVSVTTWAESAGIKAVRQEGRFVSTCPAGK